MSYLQVKIENLQSMTFDTMLDKLTIDNYHIMGDWLLCNDIIIVDLIRLIEKMRFFDHEQPYAYYSVFFEQDPKIWRIPEGILEHFINDIRFDKWRTTTCSDHEYINILNNKGLKWFKYLKKTSHNVNLHAISKDYRQIMFINNPNEEEQLCALSQDLSSAELINNKISDDVLEKLGNLDIFN